MVRGRFAPSPTGHVHLGTARTALVAWLRARSQGGAMVMRVEDLDAPRVRPGAMEAILDDLRWLGIDWDEGPDLGGPHAPYLQSQRLDRYQRSFEILRARGYLYPCTCSRKEIAEAASAPHGDEPMYPGTCRERPCHPERTPAWRFRMDAPPAFVDAIAGPSQPGLGGGDFVVRRADGVFAYQLAVVVDDREMEITEVVRGDDLLASTPRQIALHQALDPGGRVPSWMHVPLVVGADGQRLAKRHGAVGIDALRGAGTSAEAVVAFLASTLGIGGFAGEVAARDLIARFDPDRVPRAPTTIDDETLSALLRRGRR